MYVSICPCSTGGGGGDFSSGRRWGDFKRRFCAGGWGGGDREGSPRTRPTSAPPPPRRAQNPYIKNTRPTFTSILLSLLVAPPWRLADRPDWQARFLPVPVGGLSAWRRQAGWQARGAAPTRGARVLTERREPRPGVETVPPCPPAIAATSARAWAPSWPRVTRAACFRGTPGRWRGCAPAVNVPLHWPGRDRRVALGSAADRRRQGRDPRRAVSVTARQERRRARRAGRVPLP